MTAAPLIYRIRHTTRYRYASSAVSCHNILHLKPRDTESQRLLSHAIRISPTPTSRHDFLDYFGNPCEVGEIHEPHTKLEITMDCRVALDPRPPPDAATSFQWERLQYRPGTPSQLPMEVREFTFPSDFTPYDADILDYAQASFPASQPILVGALDLTRRIYDDFKYDPSATTVSTPVQEVLAKRGGVCQDFAHLQLACFRALGLPARYVSGYLQTHPAPGKERLQGADASHAWIAVFVPGYGWVDLDPTNNLIPSHEHITTAWGRDFRDVSPVSGVFTGPDSHDVSVAVDVEPEPQPEAEASAQPG